MQIKRADNLKSIFAIIVNLVVRGLVKAVIMLFVLIALMSFFKILGAGLCSISHKESCFSYTWHITAQEVLDLGKLSLALNFFASVVIGVLALIAKASSSKE
jgi:hypothetical protein